MLQKMEKIMKLVIQRVKKAAVSVEGKTVGSIGKGLMVLVGVGRGDTKEIADKYIKKLIGMRIFDDKNGKTNLSLADVGGGLLLVSQFTLYADCRKGNRPGFTDAGDPAEAEDMYDYFISECRKSVPVVETGIFGADMDVSLINDGPFTIILDEGLVKK
jgi:D-tyrosyl-tRNA(Tyr) deacylase